MSLWGWLLLFFALFSTICFIGGAISGEVLLLPPVKQRSGSILEATLTDAPVMFFSLMAANAAVAILLWGLFLAWLEERRGK